MNPFSELRRLREKICSFSDFCKTLGLPDERASKHMTAHGLRSTIISSLIHAGHSDAVVVLRFCDRDSNSIQYYQTLLSRNGESQLSQILGKVKLAEDMRASGSIKGLTVQ